MNKKVIIVVSVLLAAAIAVGSFIIINKKKNPEYEYIPAVMLTEELRIDELKSYTGKYVEDGSDASVESVAAVKLTNTGEKNYQILEFTVTTNKDTYSFKASSVHAGEVYTILEKDKKAIKDGEKIESAELTSTVDYSAEPSIPSDSLELYETHGVLNIKNVGEQDFNSVVVYFKQTDENGFFGGITYRTSFDSIKAGEVKQFNSEHFDKVVNITYEQ